MYQIPDHPVIKQIERTGFPLWYVAEEEEDEEWGEADENRVD